MILQLKGILHQVQSFLCGLTLFYFQELEKRLQVQILQQIS